MKNLILLTCIIFSFFKLNAQITDTLAYIKYFEANKANYVGQPFSKLLNEMKTISPHKLYTQQHGCNYSSQFWFIDTDRPFNSPYKMDVIWENSSLFKGEEIEEGFYSMDNVANQYKKYIIKKIEIPNGGFILNVNHYFSNKLNPSNFIDLYLKENKSDIINIPFFNFLCFLRTGSMKVTKVKNIYINSEKDVSQTIFTVNNHNNRKKTKIIVTWNKPVLGYQIKDYTNKNGKRFNNNIRNLYVDIIMKDIKIYK